jgi:hypothetical protein
MGGYVVRGLFVQEGFGFPTHLGPKRPKPKSRAAPVVESRSVV